MSASMKDDSVSESLGKRGHEEAALTTAAFLAPPVPDADSAAAAASSHHPDAGDDGSTAASVAAGVSAGVAAAMAVVDGMTGEAGVFVAPADESTTIAVAAEESTTEDKDGKPPPTKKRRVVKRRSRHGSKHRAWNDMLFELLKFRAKNGHCRVPGSKGALGSWVVQQRQQYHALKAKQAQQQQQQQQQDNKLPAAESQEPDDGKPAAAAVETKQQPEDSGREVESKRQSQALNEERIAVLNTIDFVWDVVQFDHDVRWNQRYQELVEYVRVNGHAIVPQSTPLGQWVKMQRENKKESDLKAAGMRPKRNKPRPCLTKERQEKLEAIGFVWKVAKPPVGWERRFEQLVEYQRLHGDCNVPQSYPPDKSFGRWIMKQRCEYSLKLRGQKSQLTDEREARLNAIGFSWVAPNFKRKTIPEPDHLGEDVMGRDEGIALLAGTTTVHQM